MARLVEVFRVVRRVLRPDGTLWLNCGDAYAGGAGGRGGSGRYIDGKPASAKHDGIRISRPVSDGCKAKDLIGLPWLLAFALRADGWFLRSAITLCKANPMPESVRDRPTSATEMMFLLTKRERYFYDADAVRQPHKEPWRSNGHMENRGYADVPKDVNTALSGRIPRIYDPGGRNLWNYWVTNSEPLAAEHYAAMPTAWVRPCVLAGTSERGCCAACGAPWQRVVQHVVGRSHDCPKTAGAASARGGRGSTSTVGQSGGGRVDGCSLTLGWQPTCSHNADVQPCLVLDPFAGSGTTGLVALQYGRRFVGIELSEQYIEMARRRLAGAVAQEVLELA